MTYSSLPKLYDNCKTTLKETSKDSTNKDYISFSTIEAYKFEAVRDAYCDDNKLIPKEEVNACDALYIDEKQNNEVYLIEFKNSPLLTSNINHTEIKETLLGSLLVLTDINRIGISETRKNTKFILVYSSAKDRIKRAEKSLASKTIDKKFNFKKYENIYYNQCLILGNDEFQKRFVDQWENDEKLVVELNEGAIK